MADALAAMGDTVQLSRIADSIKVMADVSGFGRDQRLHYHVIGLLLEARGYRAQAVSAFQRSLGSPNSGFTRTNYELAGLLLQLNRPRDAIPTLQAALRGGLEGGNLYITLPELEGRLAQAWEAAGKKDSAAVHYRRVVQAWQRADPDVGVRRAVAEQALQRLGESPR
jgi:tetratricopeptide (TPR) repeat protein